MLPTFSKTFRKERFLEKQKRKPPKKHHGKIGNLVYRISLPLATNSNFLNSQKVTSGKNFFLMPNDSVYAILNIYIGKCQSCTKVFVCYLTSRISAGNTQSRLLEILKVKLWKYSKSTFGTT